MVAVVAVTERSTSPVGTGPIFVMRLVPASGSNLGRAVAGSTALADRMLAARYSQLPQLRGKIAIAEISTPLTTQHFAGYGRGELYGLDHTPQRLRQGFLKPATPIPGLYLSGQDIVTCGVAGAMFGGMLTAASLLRGAVMTGLVKSALRRVIPTIGRSGSASTQSQDR